MMALVSDADRLLPMPAWYDGLRVPICILIIALGILGVLWLVWKARWVLDRALRRLYFNYRVRYMNRLIEKHYGKDKKWRKYD